MPEPLVVAVCLTKDRPEMLKRAIRCFRAQTYRGARLLVFDTGKFTEQSVFSDCDDMPQLIAYDARLRWADNAGVGRLRNSANAVAIQYTNADILIHFDDDDVSHPARIAEQVALLQASGKEAVGYREILFWNSRECMIEVNPMIPRGAGVLGTVKSVGAAWLYSHGKPSYCLGTSLCYWRRVWEKRPFEDLAHGEDHAWLKGVDSLGYSSFGADISLPPSIVPPEQDGYDPRMIASIHGSNTSPAYQYLEACEKQGEKWKRVPQWDEYCRRTMEGE